MPWLRLCGEMNRVSEGRVPLEQVIGYEARINHFIPTFGCSPADPSERIVAPNGDAR